MVAPDFFIGGHMKKIIISILTMTLAAVLLLASCEEQPVVKEEDTFEIYLATADSAREFGCSDMMKLELEGEPVITGADIRSYFWEQHVVEVTSAFAEAMFGKSENANEFTIDENGLRQYEKGGSVLLGSAQYMCFVVVVNGERVYCGTFPGSAYIPETPGEIIIGDVAENRFAIIYNGTGFDKRNNDAVYRYFKDSGKMESMPEDISEQMLEEMENRIEEFENRYEQLQQRYDNLYARIGGYEEDLEKRDAFEKWQKERLRLYMLETQEHEGHDEFCRLLESLDLTTVESISKAADFFRQSATSSDYVNDRMFNVFEEFFDTVIEGIPVYNRLDEIDEAFINTAYQNGIDVSVEEGKIYAAPRSSYLRANFDLFLSEEINEYLTLLDRELAYANNNGAIHVIQDNNLEIGMTELADLVYAWRKFATERPYNFPFNYKAMEKAEKYGDIFIGRVSLDSSDLYDPETEKMQDEAKQAYIHYINDYKDSAYYDTIAQLYVLLEENDFTFNTDVREYIKTLDLRKVGETR